MNSKLKILLAGCFLACAPAFASITFCATSACLSPNDSTNWSSLGGDQTAIAGPFDATSTDAISVTGNFSTVAVFCPAVPSCSWSAGGTGMNAGDTDIWALDNTTNPQTGTGPITLAFGESLLGAGLYIEGDTSGTFTAAIEAFNGATPLGSGVYTTTSDSSGDTVFIGILDTVAEITSIQVSLTACAGCAFGTGDFAIDTLQMVDPSSGPSPTPEPSSMLLFGSGLAGMAWTLRKRSWKSGRRS
jgi:hypothetical protein